MNYVFKIQLHHLISIAYLGTILDLLSMFESLKKLVQIIYLLCNPPPPPPPPQVELGKAQQTVIKKMSVSFNQLNQKVGTHRLIAPLNND